MLSHASLPERVVIVDEDITTVVALARFFREIGVPRINWRSTGARLVDFIYGVTPAAASLPNLILVGATLTDVEFANVLSALRADQPLSAARVLAVVPGSWDLTTCTERTRTFDGCPGPDGCVRIPFEKSSLLAEIHRLFAPRAAHTARMADGDSSATAVLQR